MEGSLFTSGFLGANFQWWIGQIGDDSEHRDNVLPGKHESVETIPGWGKRYKVRIIGLHDKTEEVIPSSQLPWAQVMYPVTGGGGQTGSGQTPNLRQGNFVFGFFLDSEDQQVPVIMGILGNNAQTALKQEIGKSETNFGPTSGYSKGAKPKEGSQADNEAPPDNDMGIEQRSGTQNEPGKEDEYDECAPPPPNVKKNKHGLRVDRAQTSEQFADSKKARQELEGEDFKGWSKQQKDDYVSKAVADGMKSRCGAKKSATAPPKPGATNENSDDTQLQSKADVVKQELYNRPIPLQDVYDPIGSSMKGMQVVLENLMNDINKVLSTALAYVDAVSAAGQGDMCAQIEGLMEPASEQMAKFMKPQMEKVEEFIVKKVQVTLDSPTDLLFPNQRHMMGDMKEQITQLVTCVFEKIVDGLSEQILSAMKGAGGCGPAADGSSTDAGPPNMGGGRGADIDQNEATPNNQAPKVPMCYVEQLVGDILSANQPAIQEPIDQIALQVDDFLKDIKSQLDELQGGLSEASGAMDSISGMMGDMASALEFSNMQFTAFGCDMDPTKLIGDKYNFQNGAGAAEDSEEPKTSEVGKAAGESTAEINPKAEKPFATPKKKEENLPAQVGDPATGSDLKEIQKEQNINNPSYAQDRQAAVETLEF